MRIPSTQALRALESFARHGSVWRAAEELHLTRSAVSHQLRLLERDLGFELLTGMKRRHADAWRAANMPMMFARHSSSSTMQANGKARLVLAVPYAFTTRRASLRCGYAPISPSFRRNIRMWRCAS